MLKNIGSLALTVFLAAGFSFWISAKQAHAYIDVSSAGFILQMLFAGLFGGLFTLKIFWKRLVDRVSSVIATFKRT